MSGMECIQLAHAKVQEAAYKPQRGITWKLQQPLTFQEKHLAWAS
jgi:hypothetical protein